MRHWRPIRVHSSTTTCGPIHVPSPIVTWSRITAPAPTCTPRPSSAPRATHAVGWTSGGPRRGDSSGSPTAHPCTPHDLAVGQHLVGVLQAHHGVGEEGLRHHGAVHPPGGPHPAHALPDPHHHHLADELVPGPHRPPEAAPVDGREVGQLSLGAR